MVVGKGRKLLSSAVKCRQRLRKERKGKESVLKGSDRIHIPGSPRKETSKLVLAGSISLSGL